MVNIRTIIFDFGNVLIDISIPRTWQLFEVLLGEGYQDALATLQAANVFDRFEMGLISEAEFLETLQRASKRPISQSTILDVWNSMLLQQPKHRLDMLLELRKKYQVLLLSNTNETHIRWVHAHMLRDLGIADFETTYFDHAYYSHDVLMRKPNADIFEFVLADANILPQETLFIDDNADNIAMAASLGIHTLHHNPENDIVAVLQQAGYV